jgi:hypothetical protein
MASSILRKLSAWRSSAEFLANLVHGDAGIFDDVVQEAGLHGDHVHAHVGQDVGHHDGMGHIGLAGIARLVLVVAAGELEGLPQRRKVVLGTVFADLVFQLAVELADRVGRNRRRNGWKGRFRRAGRLGEH